MLKQIIVAPNAFKGSLSAPAACAAMARGIAAVLPDCRVIQMPLADGGDGTSECLVQATGGRMFYHPASGPFGETVAGFWGVTGDGTTAVVEVAAASGLARTAPEKRNPLRASSYGTGKLIRQALASGCRTIFVGLGGSATSDAGAGILQALGARLLDRNGREIGPGAEGLHRLHTIETSSLDPRLKEVDLVLGYDVDNPLYGPEGAAYVYALQKGAAPEQLSYLDQALRRFAAVVEKDLAVSIDHLPGGGAAGGIGAGLAGVLGASMVPGAQKVLELAGLPDLLAGGDTDWIITGEGEINRQTLRGKVPVGVARLARQYGVPVLVLAGRLDLDLDSALQEGITTLLSIARGPISLKESISRAGELVEDATRRAVLLMAAAGRCHD